jgi:NADH-quinone oxidoreductase subunit H
MTSFPEFPHVFRLGNILAMAVVVWLVPLMMVPVFIWLERKGSATIQDRLGPNRASILGIRLFGMLHNIADAVKLFMKEDVLPKRADRLAYYLAPALSMTFALLPLMVVPSPSPSPFGERPCVS